MARVSGKRFLKDRWDKGKKANSKIDFYMIKTMRFTLINLKLLAEFP